MWTEDRKEELASSGMNPDHPQAPTCEQCNIIASQRPADRPRSTFGGAVPSVPRQLNKGYPNKRRAEKTFSSGGKWFGRRGSQLNSMGNADRRGQGGAGNDQCPPQPGGSRDGGRVRKDKQKMTPPTDKKGVRASDSESGQAPTPSAPKLR